MNKKGFFKASVQSDGTLEMLVYQEIGSSPYGDSVSANDIKEQMDAAKFDKISVRINSPGGDAFEGIAIHNLLKSTKKPIQVCVDGLAASSASIIAMAGDQITMGSNAMMMIHNAWSATAGDASELRKTADTLDKVSASIAQTYVDKTGKSMKAIQAMMDAETWMSAKDCVDNGFATDISTDNQPEALALAKTFKALNKLKAVPAQFKNDQGDEQPVACACDCENCTASNCADCTNQNCTDQNCMDCPMQASAKAQVIEEPQANNLSLYEAALKTIRLSK